jgi:hypothetical protein
VKRVILSAVLLLCAFFALPAAAQTDLTVNATAQRFERGLMIWRSDTAQIWVLADSGRAYTFAASTYGRLPDNPIVSSRLRPIMGFGKVWGNFAYVRDAIGWPTLPELGFDMRIVNWNRVSYLQQFDGTIYQINPDNTWSRAAGMPTTYVPTVPPADARVTAFDVRPLVVNRGGTISVSWTMVGVRLAKLEVYDTAANTVIQTVTGLPASGTTQLAIPASIIGNAGIMISSDDPNAPYPGLPRAEIVVNVALSPDHSVIVATAYQPYQGGFMFWRSDTGTVYVFSGTNSGSFSTYSRDFLNGLADNPYTSAPVGLVLPVNGFGRVWGNTEWIRTSLGWATTPEQAHTTMIVLAQGSPVSFALPDGRQVSIFSANEWMLL